MREEAVRDARLRPLAACVEAESAREARSRQREPEVDASLEAFERLVTAPSRRRVPSGISRWTRHAPAADRAEAWRRLLVETDARSLFRRLWAWWTTKPPSLHPRLFELVSHPVRRVRVNAATVLGSFRDGRVRAFALEMLRRDPARAIDGNVLRLLERNARDADATAVDAALSRNASRELRHKWVMGVLGLAEPDGSWTKDHYREAGPRLSPAWTPLLVRAMELAPCRHCRGSALRRLIDRGAADEATLREALFDSEDDTRSMARKALAARRAKSR